MIKKIKEILTPADIILIIILILVSIFFLFSFHRKNRTEKVKIFRHNQLLGEYSLQKQRLIELGDEVVIEIKDGKVRIKSSDCEHQYCVKQGWSNSLPIICVPNEILIVIKSKDENMMITR